MGGPLQYLEDCEDFSCRPLDKLLRSTTYERKNLMATGNICMLETDKARAVLAAKIREVKDLAKNLVHGLTLLEQERFYLLRELRKSLEELEHYGYATKPEQEELDF